MARPLRLQFAGALYHVTSRGDGRDDIYFCDADRHAWLLVLEQTCQRFNRRVHAWCQMTNHYHLLLETPEGNLSEGMRQLNGVYTQHVNRVHRRVGHVFQGRYKAVLVERDAHFAGAGSLCGAQPGERGHGERRSRLAVEQPRARAGCGSGAAVAGG